MSTARINERLIGVIRETPRCELMAVASSSGVERASQYAESWGIPRAFGSYEQMLADQDIDVVYISLPNALHAEWAIRSAEAGKHILCEKPLALTPQEVEQMTDAAEAHQVVLLDGTMMRYHPQMQRVQQLIADGTIGKVRFVQGLFTFSLERDQDIRLDPKLGGGSLWDLGSYCVDFTRTALQENPVEVQGWSSTGDGGVDLSFSGHLRFASGAIGDFYCSFQAVAQNSAQFIGTLGTLELDLPWVNKVGANSHVRILRVADAEDRGTFSDEQQFEEETLTFEDVNGYRCEVEHLVARVLDGAKPVISPDESRDKIATIVALLQSAREGKVLKFAMAQD